MERGQLPALLLVFAALIAATRLPLTPGRLYSFDDVNLAYALEDFDPRISQPQPPGYPLFVAQMHLLRWLGVDRTETNLKVLSLAGTLAALGALAWYGTQILGWGAGGCAAWLLLFHHSFWYAGLTSALRIQLALISVVVAGTSWRAWTGDRSSVYTSALALGIGAGIRPAAGVLLFPMWLIGAVRSGAGWRGSARALGLMAAVVLAWLIPTALESGGPASYFRTCWEYLADQSALTSGLAGEEGHIRQETAVRLLVWALSGTVVWPLLGALAWRRSDGLGLGSLRLAFAAVWLLPPLIFAFLVHIADAGQALAMVPAVCLLGGHILHRATTRVEPWLGREHAFLVLLLPALAVNFLIFFGRFKAPERRPVSRAQRLWRDLHDAMDLSSLPQIRRYARVDDAAIDQIRSLASSHHGPTVVVWAGGHASWRKASFYLPGLPIVVLKRKGIEDGPPVAQRVSGARVELVEGVLPLPVPFPAGARVVWIVNPASGLYDEIRRAFPLRPAPPVYYHDLPASGRPVKMGSYLLSW